MIEQILKLKSEGKRIGITFSSFDLLHAGHCSMLAECKMHCDVLVACLQTDPTIDRQNKNKPVQSVFERWVQLQSNRNVDFIIPYATEEEIINILFVIKPDCRILGEEYKNKNFTGKYVDEEIEIIYNSRKHNFSTTSLRNRIKE